MDDEPKDDDKPSKAELAAAAGRRCGICNCLGFNPDAVDGTCIANRPLGGKCQHPIVAHP